MQDESAAAPASAAVHRRVGAGMKRPHNWYQLVKFCAVGGSGFAVNLGTFSVCHELLGVHAIPAATIAFILALTNNFWWNRHWTFGAREGHAGFQAARFFTVSILAFLVQVALQQLFIQAAGLPEVMAQAVSIVLATPLNFIGNKMWSFGHRGR
jgi:putative flippase GtrA